METFQMVWEEIYEELNIKYSGTSDDITTTTGSTKQSKLSRTDILAIRSIYDTLDKCKIWKINTGTIVKEKMEGFALNSFATPLSWISQTKLGLSILQMMR
ncbi:unnamed protein product [Mucor hiemalis]